MMLYPGMKRLWGLGVTLWFWLIQIRLAESSVGDRTWIFQKCLFNCEGKECSKISDADYGVGQAFYLRWLWWTCTDDCEHLCMWRTVQAFQMDNTKVPQFYGKWPFVRFLGIQEPASMLFSFLNGLAHFVMLLRLRRRVSTSAPMYYIWHVYAVIAINAWIWAVVFHTRDFPLTEMMDYVSAVSLVMFSMFALCARILGPGQKVKVVTCGTALLTFFVYHTYYLAFVKFDYGYNMKVNIGVGVMNVAGWVLWWYKVRSTHRYAWKAAVSVTTVSALVLLELWDFPPIFWTLDAHALWHAGTAPIVILWYSFIIEDCRYVMRRQNDRETKAS